MQQNYTNEGKKTATDWNADFKQIHDNTLLCSAQKPQTQHASNYFGCPSPTQSPIREAIEVVEDQNEGQDYLLLGKENRFKLN
jgi:hypothetical protein